MGANVMRSVIDTNILIYYLAEDIDEKVYANIEQYLQESFQISVISRIELLGWQQGGDEWLTIAEKFLSNIVSGEYKSRKAGSNSIFTLDLIVIELHVTLDTTTSMHSPKTGPSLSLNKQESDSLISELLIQFNIYSLP